MYVCVCVSGCLSVCLPIFLCVYLSVCLPLCNFLISIPFSSLIFIFKMKMSSNQITPLTSKLTKLKKKTKCFENDPLLFSYHVSVSIQFYKYFLTLSISSTDAPLSSSSETISIWLLRVAICKAESPTF